MPNDWYQTTANCGTQSIVLTIVSFTPKMSVGSVAASITLDYAGKKIEVKAFKNEQAGTYVVRLDWAAPLH